MSGTAILCSGQGSQHPEMFDLLADAPQAQPVFAAAASVLGGIDPRRFVREADSEELYRNTNAQILCCTQAMAAWAALEESVARPVVVAGYSVGELAAWGVAGVFDARQVFELVAKRASAMDAATREPSGLSAVRGLRKTALESICNAHGAFIAIINGSDRFIVGGSRAALAAVTADAMSYGAQTTRLEVSVPSHTPLLVAASVEFDCALRDVMPGRIKSGVRLLSAIDGDTVYDAEAGYEKLARQIRQTVNWAACMEACKAAAASKVLELGPGDALARLMQSTAAGSGAHSVSEFRSLAGVKGWLN